MSVRQRESHFRPVVLIIKSKHSPSAVHLSNEFTYDYDFMQIDKHTHLLTNTARIYSYRRVFRLLISPGRENRESFPITNKTPGRNENKKNKTARLNANDIGTPIGGPRSGTTVCLWVFSVN